jgi:hypothetical protein
MGKALAFVLVGRFTNRLSQTADRHHVFALAVFDDLTREPLHASTVRIGRDVFSQR